MRGFDSISGTIVSHLTVNGAARPVTLTIPSAPPPGAVGAGDLKLTGTGRLAPIKAGMPGKSIAVTAGAQDVVVTLVDNDNPDNPLVFDIPCEPAAGQKTTVDTIKVAKASSKTKAHLGYQARTDKATGKATIKGTNGVQATGKVTFTLKRGAKKVGTKTVTLKRGKANAIFKKVRKHGKYKLTAHYLGSAKVKASSDSDTFRVR
jgi:hypothetical protein